jgi:6-pyruvoyltetrahydropterin/6-carboxytetrahydropterin synthase
MNEMVYLTRRFWFAASHRLHNPGLGETENYSLYGKCNNLGGHGHNYHLELTVAGEVNQRTGMVVDLAELDRFVRDHVLERFDRSYLNDEAAFEHLVPTTENLCLEIHRIVKSRWQEMRSAQGARVERVRLEETRSNFFEIREKHVHAGGEPIAR